MPRRDRPVQTERSERWLRVAANDRTSGLSAKVRATFGWASDETIEWLSPVTGDQYAEYFDAEFLQRLGVRELKVPLHQFWPAGGPRWDGLARTGSGKVILVEAKAYIEEAVDYQSSAQGEPLARIERSLEEAKQAFGANPKAPWQRPFYQYANRLAHLYFLHKVNGIDSYLQFLNFADAPDVPEPASREQWEGAGRLIRKFLGFGADPLWDRAGTLVWRVPEMLTDGAV